MDKFLDVVYTNQIGSTQKGDMFEKHFEPLTDRLKELLSDNLFREVEEILTDCAVENSRYYGVEGMKLAIGILEGTYTPLT